MAARPNKLPKDAVLLIPEPEDEHATARYGIAPGYYNPKQLLELLDQNKHNADAIHFIADMLETGDPAHDGFSQTLRKYCHDPGALSRIIETAKG